MRVIELSINSFEKTSIERAKPVETWQRSYGCPNVVFNDVCVVSLKRIWSPRCSLALHGWFCH
ncbi:hypothetical protein SOVF_074750 [Spinacia oleracea]|nr:hypothetical protein SOVF_074750 [Spinacia oleracea]